MTVQAPFIPSTTQENFDVRFRITEEPQLNNDETDLHSPEKKSEKTEDYFADYYYSASEESSKKHTNLKK